MFFFCHYLACFFRPRGHTIGPIVLQVAFEDTMCAPGKNALHVSNCIEDTTDDTLRSPGPMIARSMAQSTSFRRAMHRRKDVDTKTFLCRDTALLRYH